MIKVATIENRFEADLVTGAMTDDGLEFILRSFEDTAYDGLFVARQGYAVLLVNEEDEERAKAIVAEVRMAVENELPAEDFPQGDNSESDEDCASDDESPDDEPKEEPESE